jgi:hypothetical protein
MRIGLFTLLFLAFAACGTTEDTTATKENDGGTDEISETSELYLYSSGQIVDKSGDDGCGFMIAVKIDGNDKIFDPGSLSDEFRKNGLEVDIKYQMSRKQSTCVGTQPIMLMEIKKK